MQKFCPVFLFSWFYFELWLTGSADCLFAEKFAGMVKNNLVFAFFLCLVSVDSSNHYMKAITLVVFPVFRTNHCVKLLENLCRASGSYFKSRFLEARLFFCFAFPLRGVFVFGTLSQSLNYVVTFSSPFCHFVSLCFRDLPVDQLYFTFLHCLGLIDLFSADECAEILAC